jgi:hypothetical protein
MNIQYRREKGEEVAAGIIADDRSLLRCLKMSDADAALFLGKSRQALNSQLGPKNGFNPPDDYFKLSDILVLTSAARQLGRTFDVKALKDYIDRTRTPNKEGAPYKLLMSLLNAEPEGLDTDGADTVILILPAFHELRAKLPEVRDFLRKTVAELARRDPPCEIFVLGATDGRAQSAGDFLGVDRGRCFGSDLVDHYLPSIMVYRRATDDLKVFILTQDGDFSRAPTFIQPMLADCVRSMLPKAIRPALEDGRPGDEEAGQAA